MRQGCTLSPLLFSLYTEELAARIRGAGLGIKVGEGERNPLGHPLYADDIVLLAEDNDTMMRLLEVTGEFRREFMVKFGANKSQVMVIEGQGEEKRDRWMLGDLEIRRTREYKYLGATFNKNGLGKAKQEKETKAL